MDRDNSKAIPFSRTVRAGKRIYYIDVKQSHNGDYYLALTESKKVVSGEVDSPTVSFEKHKLFLYPEDFDKVTDAIHEAIDFVEQQQGKAEARTEQDSDIHIDLEF